MEEIGNGYGGVCFKRRQQVTFSIKFARPFFFKIAIGDGTLRPMLCAPDTDIDFLYAELNKLQITADIK